MRAIIIQFPGTNREGDMRRALRLAGAARTDLVWHKETTLPPCDLIVLPGGFSYGDYLRSGAMAARSPVLRAVVAAAARGVAVLGVCNGFQILTEAGLLPGALIRNAGLTFICRRVALSVTRAAAPFTAGYEMGQQLTIPVAHHDGNYQADAATLDRLEGEGRVVFRYEQPLNGSARAIAGICDASGRILGLMPHPENAVEPRLGGSDGVTLFRSMVEALS